MTDVSKLREELAATEHQRWADWQKWVHSRGVWQDNGVLLPNGLVGEWERQINTPYAELSEAEQAKDLAQVDRYWPLIEAYIKSTIAANQTVAQSISERSLQTQVQALKQKYEGVSIDMEKMRRLESDNKALKERVARLEGALDELTDAEDDMRSILDAHKAEIEDLEDGLVRSEGELYDTRAQLVNAKAQLSFTTSKTAGYLNDLATLFHLLQREADVDMNAVPSSPPRVMNEDDD